MQTEYSEPANVKRIRTETVRAGSREFKPNVRNKRRIVLELDVIPQNGSTIEERYVQGVDRIEVYEDRIPAVLRYLVPAQLNEIRAFCERTAEGHRREWLAVPSNRKALERHLARFDESEREHERDAYLNLKCNIRPEQYVVLYDERFRTGLGKLRTVKVVALDGETTCTPEEFFELEDEAKDREWFMAPPATVENSAERAAAPLTHAFKDVLMELRQDNSQLADAILALAEANGTKPKPKPRGRKSTPDDAA